MKTIDDYMAQVSPHQRSALERLREQILATAKDASECISYGQPAFRLGRVLCGFGATKNHCALYLFSDKTLGAFAGELAGFNVSKGTVRFQPEQPLPPALVEKLVRARLAELGSGKAPRARLAEAGSGKPPRRTGAERATSATEALAWLERRGTKKQLAEHRRYGIVVQRAFGVSVGALKKYARTLGVGHERAKALFDSGWYEARLLAAFTGDPDELTVREMNRWADAFDNWAVVDTVCFHLFDRTPLAWGRIPVWARARPELKKRAAFALLWGLSVHDKAADNERFLEVLPILEAAAADERHFVKKSVDMALRATGKRNPALNAAALAVAARLAESDDRTASWVGRSARRELRSDSVRHRLKRVPPAVAKKGAWP